VRFFGGMLRDSSILRWTKSEGISQRERIDDGSALIHMDQQENKFGSAASTLRAAMPSRTSRRRA